MTFFQTHKKLMEIYVNNMTFHKLKSIIYFKKYTKITKLKYQRIKYIIDGKSQFN